MLLEVQDHYKQRHFLLNIRDEDDFQHEVLYVTEFKFAHTFFKGTAPKLNNLYMYEYKNIYSIVGHWS